MNGGAHWNGDAGKFQASYGAAGLGRRAPESRPTSASSADDDDIFATRFNSAGDVTDATTGVINAWGRSRPRADGDAELTSSGLLLRTRRRRRRQLLDLQLLE